MAAFPNKMYLRARPSELLEFNHVRSDRFDLGPVCPLVLVHIAKGKFRPILCFGDAIGGTFFAVGDDAVGDQFGGRILAGSLQCLCKFGLALDLPVTNGNQCKIIAIAI